MNRLNIIDRAGKAQEDVSNGEPKKEHFAELEAAQAALAIATEALRAARERTFREVAKALDLPVDGQLPAGIEISATLVTSSTGAAALGNAFLIESAEPLSFDRLQLAVSRSDVIPLAKRTLDIRGLGALAPDRGELRDDGVDWTFSHELWTHDGGLRARLDEPWTLEIAVPDATRVTLEAIVPRAAQSS